MESSRKIGINSLSVLSHHRAYRSVHGGSLINTFDSPIIIRKENIPGLSKTFTGDRYGQDRAPGCMPVALSCIRILPSLVIHNTQLLEVTTTGAYPFPLFPYHHP